MSGPALVTRDEQCLAGEGVGEAEHGVRIRGHHRAPEPGFGSSGERAPVTLVRRPRLGLAPGPIASTA